MALIRTRFAPSPSGFLHLGNARTALFAYLFARHSNGRFVLRIEDTDLERIVPGSEQAIFEDLKWLDLSWDEGPDVGGPLGPYRCSERFPLYEEQLKRFRKCARVYRCFCTLEQLDQDRKLLASQKKVIKYVGRCLNLSDQESQVRADKKENFVWRLHVPEGGPVVLHDIVRGEVQVEREVLGDFVLFRSSGVPVFLFANAMDDALQEMTHVIRGEDHLSNTFRQILIYELLGLKLPQFAHLPMIGAESGEKLSKREGSLSIRDLKVEGYLPEAVGNYIALLGWSPGDTAHTGEKFSKEELIQLFDLHRVHKGRALFDSQKFRFLNHEHMKDLSLEELEKLAPCREAQFQSKWKEALQLIRHDAWTLQELYKIETYLHKPQYEELTALILKKDISQKALEKGLILFKEKVKNSTAVGATLKECIQQVGKELGLKGKDLFFPFRMAITGTDHGPELIPLVEILGSQEIQSRLQTALQL